MRGVVKPARRFWLNSYIILNKGLKSSVKMISTIVHYPNSKNNVHDTDRNCRIALIVALTIALFFARACDHARKHLVR